MTAEGSTGAPLPQQIAEAIHAMLCDKGCSEALHPLLRAAHTRRLYAAADAVVALLNLTEERWADLGGYRERIDYVGPWLPSTPPDTSSSETT